MRNVWQQIRMGRHPGFEEGMCVLLHTRNRSDFAGSLALDRYEPRVQIPGFSGGPGQREGVNHTRTALSIPSTQHNVLLGMSCNVFPSLQLNVYYHYQCYYRRQAAAKCG